MTFRADYTREELITICEQAIVPEDKWDNRDSASAQANVGMLWAHLKAGSNYKVVRGNDIMATDEDTIWVMITYRGFKYFETGEESFDLFYLPQPSRIGEEDWYSK